MTDPRPAMGVAADPHFGGLDALEAGRRLFAGDAAFFWAADRIDGLPPMGPAEIAVAGRSNVGKSSLINALTGRKALARTSNTPGRTQLLNFFRIGDRFSLVDMPGYGYAAVSKAKVANWTRLIKDYLRGRASLLRVYLLIDSRHGLKETDREILDLLDQAAVSYQIVLTKADALTSAAGAARVAEVAAAIRRRPAAFPEVLLTSSATGEGIPALRAAVWQLLQERGG